MATLFKNLLGNNTDNTDIAGEMRAVLYELRQERGHCEALVNSARATVARFQELGEPLERTDSSMQKLTERIAALEQRLTNLDRHATRLQAIDENADRLAERQRQVETRIGRSGDRTQQLEGALAELSAKVEVALELKDQLGSLLELEAPFRKLEADAGVLGEQVGSTAERLTRIRDEHDRVMEAHAVAHAKLSAFDHRQDELARTVQEKERRVAAIEQALAGLGDVHATVEDAKQRLGTVKALGDQVAQKTAALEAQRDAVERAVARAETLDTAVRQIDAGMRQQHENAASMAELQKQVESLQALADEVMRRADQAEQTRQDATAQLEQVRTEVAAATAEARRSVERFDFESRGVEAVSLRIADLREAATALEARFAGLGDSHTAAAELKTELTAATTRLESMSSEISRLSEEAEKVQALRRGLDAVTRVAETASGQLARLEEARPAVEVALREIERLRGTHALVTDSMERAQHAGAELARLREEQADTRTWLTGVEATLAELGERAADLRKIAPTMEFIQGQVQRVNESMSGIESRREAVDEMHRRMMELSSVSATLDERGRELVSRMETAEQRFVGLATHAEEAERLGGTVAGLVAAVQEAERDLTEVGRTVVTLQSRCESIEGLAERTRALRNEIEQRQHALEEAARDLEQATELRQHAAATAQELEERSRQLTSALSAAERQSERVASMSQQLENRAEGLRFMERRVGQFEERLARWELVDQEVARTLDQINARQATVDALQADIVRMSNVAERTAENVRAITHARREIDESRAAMDDLLKRLEDVHVASSGLDERRRQLGQAEGRLARADALLIDVRSSLQLLETQKVVVDQAVEKAGALEFLLRQADAMIQGLREERDMTTRIRTALAATRDEEAPEATVARAG